MLDAAGPAVLRRRGTEFFRLPTTPEDDGLRTLAELEFVGRAQNVVFIGPTGVGKTAIVSAILLRALENGHRGLFFRAQDLFDEMYASLADRSARVLLDRLRRRCTTIRIDGPSLRTPEG